MSENLEAEPLANLLDFEPELFLGATSSEVGWIVGVATVSWLVFFTVLFLGFALWVDILSLAFAAIPASAIAIFCSTVFALKRLQRAKMNRPEGYHIILIKLRTQKLSQLFGAAPYFETYTGTWGIERYDL